MCYVWMLWERTLNIIHYITFSSFPQSFCVVLAGLLFLVSCAGFNLDMINDHQTWLLCNCYDFIMIIKHYAMIMMTMLVMTIMTIVIIMMCRHCILPLNDLWRVVWYLFDDDKNKSNICRHCLLPLHALWRAFRPEKWTHVSSKLGKHRWVKEKV